MTLASILLQATDLPSGYGTSLLQAFLALVAVCLLAWVALRWAAKLGLGRAPSGKRVRVVERVALDARRALYVVEVGERHLLLSVGDGAAPRLITELTADEMHEPGADAISESAARIAQAAQEQGAD